MSPRTANRAYFYYACTVGPSKRHHGCSAKKFHPAAELEGAIADGQSSKLPIGRVLAEAEQPIDIHWAP